MSAGGLEVVALYIYRCINLPEFLNVSHFNVISLGTALRSLELLLSENNADGGMCLVFVCVSILEGLLWLIAMSHTQLCTLIELALFLQNFEECRIRWVEGYLLNGSIRRISYLGLSLSEYNDCMVRIKEGFGYIIDLIKSVSIGKYVEYSSIQFLDLLRVNLLLSTRIR